MVNSHGEAFRNARIRVEYLDARLSELKLAVAVTELKEEEREEQRRIQQEMREEERVRRECEKAINDAQKEERLLEKLMAEARAKLQVANEGEKAGYEANLWGQSPQWHIFSSSLSFLSNFLSLSTMPTCRLNNPVA